MKLYLLYIGVGVHSLSTSRIMKILSQNPFLKSSQAMCL